MDTSIRVKPESKKKLHRIKDQIETKTGEPSNLEEVINELIKNYKGFKSSK